ncbi:MAG: prepilin-type N-terminal cleavage/methylation domain-containing protein [Phycisphaerales bacterium]|nr:prepilin-type N-terminal cleavage/methylation domain-containing protein [Phycisphaerales bacterium]
MHRARPTTSSVRTPARPGGFTLIEVLVTVAILAIAAAMVIPAMGTTGVLKVQGAIRQIVSDITFAQSDAIAQQQGRAVKFETATNSYRLIQVVGATVDDANTLYEPSRQGGRYVTSLNNADFGGATISSTTLSGNTLVFDDMGTPVTSAGGNTPSTGGKVVLITGTSRHEVLIEAYTGRTTIRKVSGN